jgi:reverse gyrase
MAIRPFEFPKYKTPQLVAESDDGQMSTEDLGTLLGKVSDTSTGKIDNLIGDFEGLRRKLQTDRERIQREIEEYNALSQEIMQVTKIISESMQKLRTVSASLDN